MGNPLYAAFVVLDRTGGADLSSVEPAGLVEWRVAVPNGGYLVELDFADALPDAESTGIASLIAGRRVHGHQENQEKCRGDGVHFAYMVFNKIRNCNALFS